MKKLTVLYEDDEILVINKPAGLAVQGGKGVGVSLDAMLAVERTPAPFLVHRLDKDTSGALLTAKTKAAAAKFSLLLEKKPPPGSKNGAQGKNAALRSGLEKIYLALCAGGVPQKGIITGDLVVHGRRKSAQTRYRRLGLGLLDGAACSLLQLELGTGRMHQIRRHLAGLGFPILGDEKYGDFKLNKALRKSAGLKRLFLHAHGIRLPSGLLVTAPLPDYWLEILTLAALKYSGL